MITQRLKAGLRWLFPPIRTVITSSWFVVAPIFALWLFGWLPVKPPAWLAEGPAIDPIIAHPQMARSLFFVILIVISIGPFAWLGTWVFTRRCPLRDLPRMLMLVAVSKRGARTLLVILLAFGILGYFVFRGAPWGSFFVRIELATICGVLMNVTLPPTAIVLANSSEASGSLLEMVAQHLIPLRVVSLLNGTQLGPHMFVSQDNNFRTIGGESWRPTVHELVEITPLVFVDARSATPPVCDEIRHMAVPQRVGKAVFVIKDDGTAPGLEAAGLAPRATPPCYCTVTEVPAVIDSFKRTGRIVPLPPAPGFEWQRTKCAECGKPMSVLAHKTQGPGVAPMTRRLLEMMNRGVVRGTFYCRTCRRFYCFECSDSAKRCRCGAEPSWGEGVYLEEQ